MTREMRYGVSPGGPLEAPGDGGSTRAADAGGPSGLRRFLERREQPPEQQPAAPGTRCEMCSEPLMGAHSQGGGHSHVVNVETRRILCTCRPCYLLFTHPGAGGGKHRAVPDRYLYAPSFPPGATLWESSGIPVGMAFLFRSSTAGPVAFYPSPAGATESTLPLRAWEAAVDNEPRFRDIAEDVEALLVNQLEDDEFEAFLVPIDACYELVGVVRTHWRGFDGGTEARQRIRDFFDRLRTTARRIEVGDE